MTVTSILSHNSIKVVYGKIRHMVENEYGHTCTGKAKTGTRGNGLNGGRRREAGGLFLAVKETRRNDHLKHQ